MKNHQIAHRTTRRLLGLALAVCLAFPLASTAASIALATAPLASASTSSVKPNVVFMLDDSGSMAWDYMPDDSAKFAGDYGFNTNHCNGVYYNPAITYTPPVDSTGTSYPNSSFTAAWDDGYNTSAGTSNLNTDYTGGSGSGSSGINLPPDNAFFYTYSGTQTTGAQMDYHNTSSIFYKECISPIGSTTKVDGTNPVNSVFQLTTLATNRTVTITVSPPGGATINLSGRNTTTITKVLVNGAEILPATTNKSTSSSTVAGNIANGINSCTSAVTGSCTVSGYSATVSGSTVTIYGPVAADGYTPAVSCGSCGMTFSNTAFPTVAATTVSSIKVNGTQLLLSGPTASTNSRSMMASYIAAGINATGYSATASANVVTVTGPASATNYTPVITSSPTSTGLQFTTGQFPESDAAKLQNFANWYSYYSNRMLMMKTGVGQAFASLDDKYRVGFLTMNNNVKPDIVDINTFDATQKSAWYSKLYASSAANSTPLREALSHVGQWYAHKFGAITTYTATITVSGSGSTVVNDVTVNGAQITANPSSGSTKTNTVASNVNNQINQLDPSDFGSSVSGNVITITGPASVAGMVPVIDDDGGGMTFTATAFTGTTVNAQLNGITPSDPVQYSCQQNFLILSTDGYWNGSTTYDLNNNPVGNQDGGAPRPMFDGALANKTTSQVYQTQTQLLQSTSQLQMRTLQTQQRTQQITQRTQQITKRTVQNQKDTVQNQQRTQQITQRTQQITKRTVQNQKDTIQYSACKSNGTSCSNIATCANVTSSRPLCKTVSDTGWVNIGTCTASAPSGGPEVICQVASDTGYVNASSCTTSNPSSGPTVTCNTTDTGYVNASSCTASSGGGQTITCNTTDTGWVNVGTCTASSGGGQTVTCQVASDTGWVNIGTCTASNPTSGPTVTCQVASDTGYVNASSCTASNPTSGPTVTCNTTDTGFVNASSCTASSGGGQTITCNTTDTGFVNASSCTPSGPTAGQTVTCNTTDTGWVGASSCSASGPTGGKTITCQGPVTTGPTPVVSCTNASASSTNNWTQTTCATTTYTPKTLVASCACTTTPSCSVTGSSPNYITTTCDTSSSTTNNVSSCTPQTASASNGYITITCAGGSGGTSDTLADAAMYYYQTDLRDSSLYNCTGAASTDFPSGNPDVCKNNVYISGADNNVDQHMTTFTLGLGTRGRMVYTSKDYMNDTSGDFFSVKTGATANLSVSPQICSWQSTGTTCNWPIPSSGSVNNIDDLWHAAVDGRGTYFSATDPTALSDGLSSALSSITARKGSAAAAATSTLNPVAGNNYAYVASYTTVKWIGNLEARSINVNTGVISDAATWCVENLTAGTCASPGTEVTDASGSSTTYSCVTPSTAASCTTSGAVFDATAGTCSVPMAIACNGTLPPMVGATSDTRNIYTANSSGTALVSFKYANLTSAQQAYFSYPNISALSQWTSLTSAQQTTASGANLVNYLRGQYGYEAQKASTTTNELFRYREAILGDALESQPAYLGTPTFSYVDPGYSAFVTAKSSRPGTVYMGTNDGMLHAFASDTGIERWAYVPSMVMQNMWILADTNYDSKHTNFVNGSPTTSDVCVANCTDSATADWRTILVGGLNGGGRGYYALDITDPTAPTLLWEFTTAQEPNVGYSFGQPVITKKTDGTWVVLLTSGYNNTSPGDGKGYLFVVNAFTGAEISAISTNVGDTTTPSGFARIAAWNDDPTSNLAGGVYGGDVLGNVWRFDINLPGSTTNPLLFATLKDPSGNPQPVTTSPVLGLVDNKRVIFIGTGKYLEPLDLSSTQVESEYAIKDDNNTATIVNPRSHTLAPKMVQQTLTANGSTRTVTSNSVDFSTDLGWYVDFPDSGERVNIDSQLIQGTLLVPTIVPSSTVCSPGGTAWLNYFDYSSGGPVQTAITSGNTTNTEASAKYDSTIVGVNIIYIGGVPKVEIVTSTDPTPRIDTNAVISAQTGKFSSHRMLWRELIP